MRSQASLELGQHQQLALTPQLRQALRLLQCSTLELEQEIAQAVADNPVLELDEPATDAVSAQAEMLERHWAQPARQAVTDDIPESPASQSLTDHLLQQLRTTRASLRDQALGVVLIGELDEHGYLDFDPVSHSTALPPDWDVQEEEWRAARRLLQSFDPAGVGARDLPECLRLQLRSRAAQWPPDVLDCALRLTRFLEDLGAGRWGRLCAALGCSRALLDAAHQALLQLDPRPLSAWQEDTTCYVVPDVLFHRSGTRWAVSLNPALEPRLRVDAGLAAQLEREGAPVLREQVRVARQLVQSLGQRRQTILRVAEFIAVHQRAFLEQGASALRPLVLREVAQALELHESTISRATRLKYAQTPWGVVELKHFFGTGVQTASGEDASARAIQAVMRVLLDAESPGKPLSDMRLSQLLADQGLVIARRTVAKYREALGVPVASLRKAQGK
ncbi:RNA polymerase factor sigma-54 [Castellaniella sp.]|uniref:RNA polymerase factor sigma-54 n=1 Tax=Castellaniella sp. TaxID=1955812 RepID=UPI002AFF0847|nr:RNA polymerase factor sigma-54 [Castellaniella sp.]